MHEIFCDVAVIGAGPAGLAAAVSAKKQGVAKVLIIERDISPGGILQQCIHPGFGLTYYNEELTGPEYAGRFVKAAEDAGVEFLFDTMVLEVSGRFGWESGLAKNSGQESSQADACSAAWTSRSAPPAQTPRLTQAGSGDRRKPGSSEGDSSFSGACPAGNAVNIIICVNKSVGMAVVYAKSIVLAMGCRERTRGNLALPGTRPAGVYTAGAAQRLINRQNIMPGKRVLILGSGDIGMIMARRLTLEGAEVIAVVEIMNYLTGLTRNRVQCLDDFGIPLLLSHSVTRIEGAKRLTGCMVAQVDENRKPIPETEKFYECDTLLLSVGLIPENELSLGAGVKLCPVTGGPIVNQFMQTSIPGIFACGNVVHVNDLADNVSAESEIAGSAAAHYALGLLPQAFGSIVCVPGNNVRYVCPQTVALTNEDAKIKLYFRVQQPYAGARISANYNGREILSKKAIKVNPGEMEYVAINSASLQPPLHSLSAEMPGEIIISVEKEA
ncbi:MAG: FAD-dependent oxidoreductase [Spirochaetes bacterium]|nr:FAD-dependent oxidoreductase [Spirochaetota bacterium]